MSNIKNKINANALPIDINNITVDELAQYDIPFDTCQSIIKAKSAKKYIKKSDVLDFKKINKIFYIIPSNTILNIHNADVYLKELLKYATNNVIKK
jgi:hypothetical protein